MEENLILEGLLSMVTELKEKLEFTYERDNQTKQLHLDVNQSFLSPQKEEQVKIIEEIPDTNIEKKELIKVEKETVDYTQLPKEEKMLVKEDGFKHEIKEEPVSVNIVSQEEIIPVKEEIKLSE